MEHVDDDYFNLILACPVPTAADRARNSQPHRRRRRRSSEETTGVPTAADRARNSQPRRRRRRRSSEETTGGPKSPNRTRLIRDILLINAGEDVVESILSHFNKIPPPSRGRLGIILSATGFVLNPVISSRILTKPFEGSFPITNLTGNYVVPKAGRVRPYHGLNITFQGSDGEIVGGRVDGSLIAATEIQLCIGSFPHKVK